MQCCVNLMFVSKKFDSKIIKNKNSKTNYYVPLYVEGKACCFCVAAATPLLSASVRLPPSLPAFVSRLLTTFHLKHLNLDHFSGFVSPVSSPTILLVSGSIKLFIWVSLSQFDSAIDSVFTVCFCIVFRFAHFFWWFIFLVSSIN